MKKKNQSINCFCEKKKDLIKIDKILIKIKYVIRNIKRINNFMYWKEDVRQT